jgi:hypothetical protein
MRSRTLAACNHKNEAAALDAGNPCETGTSGNPFESRQGTRSERKRNKTFRGARKSPEESPEQSRSVRAFVYVIGDGWDGPVKIGISARPGNRLRALQTSSPHKLRVLVKFLGTQKDEATLHRPFAAYRMEGEWFQRSKPINDFIADVASGRIEVDPLEPSEPDTWIETRSGRRWSMRQIAALAASDNPFDREAARILTTGKL